MADSTAATSSTAVAAAPMPSGAAPFSVYLCASIRGEVVSKPFLNALIGHCKQHHGPVLTEHIGFDTCEKADMTNKGQRNAHVSSCRCRLLVFLLTALIISS